VDALTIRAGSELRAHWQLEYTEPRANLVRNPDFQIRWTAASPDQWRADEKLGAWISDNIKVEGGGHYRFQVNRMDGNAVRVQLAWYKNHWQPAAEPVTVESESDLDG
jgi:hypothetical protein